MWDVCDVGMVVWEVWEEIGMWMLRDVEVVGWLLVVMLRYRVSVRLVVGVVWEGFCVCEEEILCEEVVEVFMVLLEMFLSVDCYWYDDWVWSNGARLVVRVYYFEYEGRTIWGFTVMILIEVV